MPASKHGNTRHSKGDKYDWLISGSRFNILTNFKLSEKSEHSIDFIEEPLERTVKQFPSGKNWIWKARIVA